MEHPADTRLTQEDVAFLELVHKDVYLTQLQTLLASRNWASELLPSEEFRIKHILCRENSLIGNPVYKVLSKTTHSPLLYASKQMFGKYVFFIDETQKEECAYMSKYGDEYKLYVKQGDNKVEMGYFILPEGTQGETDSRAVFPKVDYTNKIEKIISNIKGKSEIKWLSKEKPKEVLTLQVGKTCGNILGLRFVYVSS